MVAIPFIYFLGVFIYFLSREQKWNLDLAATSLLVAISFFAIIIDIRDLYGDYGINEDYITLPTILLFCLQWTIVLLPIHIVSMLPLKKHPPIKIKLLYILFFILIISSVIMIITNSDAIIMGFITDQADLYQEHLEGITEGGSSKANYLMFLPQIFTATPFPTLALFLWFYMSTFMKCPLVLRIGMLIASIVQAISMIAIAGRSSLAFWVFDFYLLYGYFHQYLSKSIKKRILLTSAVMGGLIMALFITITIARFDTNDHRRNPMDSLYGYAGQQVDNFCTMFAKGSDVPFSIEREMPLTARLLQGKRFNVIEYYDTVAKHVDVLVNVFDTFGGELYLDMGWIGYIGFFILFIIFTLHIKLKWKEMLFYRTFIFVLLVAFFTKGLYYWPFMSYYVTYAIILFLISSYLFKYTFKI